MNQITYMWNFKPNEKTLFPLAVIRHNQQLYPFYRIVTPNISKNLLQNDIFPQLSVLYSQLPHWICKADLTRLLIIYFKGGIYADADCFFKKKLIQHNPQHNMILFTEHICKSVNDLGPLECKNNENLLRVANYCFAARTIKHPFLKEVIDECLLRIQDYLNSELSKNTLEHNTILWLCGPDVITTVYHRSKNNYKDLFLYPKGLLDHRCYGSWR